jgi:hypothetical protein
MLGMQQLERGSLLIADIGGYTNFLTAVELEHSTDILSDLIGAIVQQASGAFRLAKLEGDAVFCVALDGTVDGPAFLTILESCYFAFVERLRDIAHASTCDCGACRLTPSLHLKFVAHHGAWAVHQVAGSTELAGSDVIAVHRLLKNHVVEVLGKQGYAFLTSALTDALNIDPRESDLAAHDEPYDDVGTITGYVMDLEARWEEHQREQRVFVTPGESYHTTAVEIPAPPAVVWDWLNSPDKMRQWAADDMVGVARAQRRGIGTTNHCVHGNQKLTKRVLDWKPFDYVTESNASGPVEFLATFQLTALEGDRTRLEFRVRPVGSMISRTMLRLFGGPRFKEGDKHFQQLAALLGDPDAWAGHPAPAASAVV